MKLDLVDCWDDLGGELVVFMCVGCEKKVPCMLGR